MNNVLITCLYLIRITCNGCGISAHKRCRYLIEDAKCILLSHESMNEKLLDNESELTDEDFGFGENDLEDNDIEVDSKEKLKTLNAVGSNTTMDPVKSLTNINQIYKKENSNDYTTLDNLRSSTIIPTPSSLIQEHNENENNNLDQEK